MAVGIGHHALSIPFLGPANRLATGVVGSLMRKGIGVIATKVMDLDASACFAVNVHYVDLLAVSENLLAGSEYSILSGLGWAKVKKIIFGEH
ncbi:hypothetical protein GCM10025790_27000 [Nesterenkonia rhizosphaerae]|uniref:Uncharacterized protein n=1 Tax=Nesterenkonia rhizosphaerae TaxID=1348272 RepID=A0ABP9G568_9MICC